MQITHLAFSFSHILRCCSLYKFAVLLCSTYTEVWTDTQQLKMAQVRNKQVVLKDHVTGFPKESDMNIVEGTITLKVPEGSSDILLKNLYLSCDPYMRLLMNDDSPLSLGFGTYTPGSVSHNVFFIYLFIFDVSPRKFLSCAENFVWEFEGIAVYWKLSWVIFAMKSWNVVTSYYP